jgi:hypothetical protein
MAMNWGVAVLGLAIIALGIFMLFNKDAMWTLTEWGNSLKGVKSERTDAWEQGNGCSGFAVIIFGVGLLVLSIMYG